MTSLPAARKPPGQRPGPSLYPDTEDGGLEDELALHHALRLELAARGSQHLLAPDEDHLLPRGHYAAEADGIEGTEPEEGVPREHFPRVEGTELRGRLEHQDTGEERPSGDVTLDPELVFPHFAEADDGLLLRAHEEHRRQLLELVAVGVDLPDVFDRVLEVPGVECVHVVEKLLGHEVSVSGPGTARNACRNHRLAGARRQSLRPRRWREPTTRLRATVVDRCWRACYHSRPVAGAVLGRASRWSQ